MGKLYYDDIVPVPEGSHVVVTTKRVSDYIKKNGETMRKRLIGKLCNIEDVPAEIVQRCPEGTRFMYPNDNYYDKRANDYLEFNPKGRKKVAKYQLIIGLYALVLAISIKLGIYKIIIEKYGARIANEIMDFAMYSILYQTSKPETFTELMSNHVLFSIDPLSDSTYSELFADKMNEDINSACEKAWTAHCIEEYSLESVAISIDGTNNNCSAEDNDLAAYGHAKTHIHIPVIGMLWAVVAEGPHKGMVLSYEVNKGSMPDSKQMEKMIAFWKGNNIKVKVALFDRGFPTDDVITLLLENGIPYQAMLKENTEGFKEMYEKHAFKLMNEAKYVLPSYGMSGIVDDDIKATKSSTTTHHAGLFYDSVNAAQRRAYFIDKLFKAKFELEEKLDPENAKKPKKSKKAKKSVESENVEDVEGEEELTPEKAGKYFKIVPGENGTFKVEFDINELQKTWYAKGFSVQISNLDLSAQEMDENYNLRDTSEKQFSILKSQLGFDVGGVESPGSWLSKLFVAVVASIIRNEIQLVCKEEGLNTNQIIKELGNVTFSKGTDYYYFSRNFPEKVATVFKHFGICIDDMEGFTTFVNLRYRDGTEDMQVLLNKQRELPPLKKDQANTASKNEQKDENSSKESKPKGQRGGRKQGSLNKSTLEKRQAEMAARIAMGLPPEEPPQPKRGPGRPQGSKNKKTLQQEAEDRELTRQTGIDILGELPGNKPTGRQKRKKLRELAQQMLQNAASF